MNAQIQPGMVVAVPIDPLGILFHEGIVGWTYDGSLTVISSSEKRGGVYEETLGEFANGRRIKVIGWIGSLAPDVIVARARSKIGTPYHMISWNCQQFVRYACGLRPESPALQVATAVVAAVALGVALTRAAR